MGRHAQGAQAGRPPDHPRLCAQAIAIQHRRPKEIGNLYTRAMLEEAFRDFHDVAIAEEELELYEGTSHGGMWHVSRHQSDGTKVASPNGASPDLTITSR